MGQAIVLTGRPGVGKTTVVRAVVDRLGLLCGGFYTEEIRERGRRTGFRLVALDGTTGILASVNIASRCRVGKYGVHLPDLDRVGTTALRRAVRQPEISLVVIDEIGKMELCSSAFREAVLEAMNGPKVVLATAMSAPQPWVDQIKARPEVTVVEVTMDSRDALPEQVVSWVSRHLEPDKGR
jgi:nucleoside-triphosphatase